MGTILVLHGSPTARRRIEHAVALERAEGLAYELVFLCRWHELRQVVRVTASALAIVDPYFRPAAGRGGELTQIVRGFPSLAVILYGDFSGRPAQDIAELAELRPADIITMELDDQPQRLQASIRCAVQRNVLAEALLDLESRLGSNAYELVTQVLRRTDARLHTPELAAMLGLGRRTLERRLQRAGLPAPARLMMWCRLMHAARLLEDPGRTVENVAFALGFGSAAALCAALKRYTGFRSIQLRSRGAVSTVISAFVCRRLEHTASSSSAVARERHGQSRGSARGPGGGADQVA